MKKWDNFVIDNDSLIRYTEEFKRENKKYLDDMLSEKDKILKRYKEAEKKVNWKDISKEDIDNNNLLNIMVYIYRYIFVKSLKTGIFKKIRMIKKYLDNMLFILERNQVKIEKYLSQSSNSKIKLYIMWKEYKNIALELEDINVRNIYYIHYLKNEIQIIESITDWLEQVNENIFNNKSYYDRLENILERISTFIIITGEWDNQQENLDKIETETKIEEKKITLVNKLKEIYNESNKKILELTKDFKKRKEIDKSINTIVDYLNRYMKYKDILELYYNKIYDNIVDIPLEYTFKIEIEEDDEN